ncbi:hypothetical protein LTR37_017148 [Vermiconidia calcicola]|uniref:Uncharacterized protein n=1 Tax=Vermiconidia calcicola TaxID=1690605 RepID=A0ACC3MKT4_9PEZI|nr:hypothetical protein LTR37_017148 [Vermiconidia calcicola]
MANETQSEATPSNSAQLAPSVEEMAALKAKMDSAKQVVEVKDAQLRCPAGILADLVPRTATSDDQAHEVFGQLLNQRLSQSQRQSQAERQGACSW